MRVKSNCEPARNPEEIPREIRIAVGILELESGAFAEYNKSNAVTNVFRLLRSYNYHMNEWKKQLRRRQAMKLPFPPEVKTLHQKAEYMMKQETDLRIHRLYLPKSCEAVTAESFPVLLEAIEADAEHKTYVSIDGVLFSRDKKTLIRYPGYPETAGYRIPDGTSSIAPGAFSHSYIRELYIPGSVKQIGDYAFRGITGIEKITCESGTISMGVGLFEESHLKDVAWWCWSRIPRGAFLNAALERITVPEGVLSIADYAFAGCYRAKDITIPDSVQEIGPQSFDEGPTYDRSVKLPMHLYKYVYRFPARSKINGMAKNQLWSLADKEGFTEEPAILERQKQSLEQLAASMNLLQAARKRKLQNQIAQLDMLLGI